jgi:hypothetical protein
MSTPHAARFSIVFVLTTSGDDIFTRMQALAARSVRRAMPQAHLILVLDNSSHGNLCARFASLLDLFDEVRPVNAPPGSPGWINRWMKTRLRALLDGDFLYLDADVIVRDNLMVLWRCGVDIGGVRTANVRDGAIRPWERRRYEELGWEPPAHGSINGGVLFWPDTARTHELANCYHRRWLEGFERTGQHYDQQALNRALADYSAHICVYQDIYNAQVWFNPKFYIGAVIWHFYSSNISKCRKGIWTYWHNILTNGDPMTASLEWIDREHPLLLDGPLERRIFQSLRRDVATPSVKDWRHLWLERRYRKALKRALLADRVRDPLPDQARLRR